MQDTNCVECLQYLTFGSFTKVYCPPENCYTVVAFKVLIDWCLKKQPCFSTDARRLNLLMHSGQNMFIVH